MIRAWADTQVHIHQQGLPGLHLLIHGSHAANRDHRSWHNYPSQLRILDLPSVRIIFLPVKTFSWLPCRPQSLHQPAGAMIWGSYQSASGHGDWRPWPSFQLRSMLIQIEKTMAMLIWPSPIVYPKTQRPHYPEIYFQILPIVSPSVCSSFLR